MLIGSTHFFIGSNVKAEACTVQSVVVGVGVAKEASGSNNPNRTLLTVAGSSWPGRWSVTPFSSYATVRLTRA